MDLEKELQSSEDLHPTFSGRDILSSTLSPCVSPSGSMVPLVNETLVHRPVSVQEKQKTLSNKRQPPTSLQLRPSSEMPCNHMTASIDSAIQSAPGSRSGSSSPISHLTQSMMRYESGFGVSAFGRSAEAEQKLKNLFGEINQLLFNSNLDCSNNTNHEINLPKNTYQDRTGSTKSREQFKECLSKSCDCNPCEKCRRSLLKLDILRKQNQFLFAQTPITGTDLTGKMSALADIQNQNSHQSISPFSKDKASINRDSAIDLEWPLISTNPNVEENTKPKY